MFARRGWLRFLWPVFGAAITLLAVAAPSSAAVPAHGRIWELVSADDTGGAQILITRAYSRDGERMVFTTLGPMPGAASGEVFSHNLATRTPSGWHSVPITVPYTAPSTRFFATAPLAVSADLSSWLWGSLNPLLPGAPANPLLGLYRRDPGGGLALIGSIGPESAFIVPAAASTDLANVGFDLREALVAADSGRIAGAAAYEVVGNELRLAGVGEHGEPTSPCGSIIGVGGPQDLPTRKAAMSRDGSRIFFTSPDPSTTACATPTAVYLREDGAHTIEISASHCTRPDCGPVAEASFAGASADGSTAFIVTAQQLTNDDVDTAADLYRYDRAAESLTRVSAGPPGTAANVIPPIRVAEDGSRVYFRATGSLVPGQSSEATSNVYLREGDGPIRYVADISGQGLGSAAIDADGSVLLFTTSVALLPGDTDTTVDVYRYDAASTTLVRVSASSGGGDSGNEPVDATIPPGEEVFPTQGPNTLSLNGEHAFFLTPEALLAEDENDEVDLYEWAGGDLGLISPGAKEAKAITYEGASADGSSVFFETRRSLVPEDDDGGEGDLYAARLGGGFPALPAAPECAGEACRGPIPGRPSTPAPVTASGTAESHPARRRGLGLQLGARARRLLASGERGVAIVRAPAAGRVRLSAFARIAGRDVLVATADAVAWRAGRLAVPFRLSADARDLLDRHRRLRLRLVVRHSQVPQARETVVTLGGPR